MLKKIIFVLIAAAILVSVFSCGETAETSNPATDNGIVEDNAGNITETDESAGSAEPVKMLPDLPDNNYEGHQFTFLAMNDTDGFLVNDTFAEEMNGDIINDAIYARNLYVEDKYNVKISTVNLGFCVMGSGQTTIQRAAAAGDYIYDAAILSAYDTCNLVTQGLLRDLNEMPLIDLSKPWWDQKANEDLSIKGRLYFTTGDLSPAMKSSTSVMFFNKKLHQDYGLEDPYALVKSGKWTYDKWEC